MGYSAVSGGISSYRLVHHVNAKPSSPKNNQQPSDNANRNNKSLRNMVAYDVTRHKNDCDESEPDIGRTTVAKCVGQPAKNQWRANGNNKHRSAEINLHPATSADESLLDLPFRLWVGLGCVHRNYQTANKPNHSTRGKYRLASCNNAIAVSVEKHLENHNSYPSNADTEEST